MPMPQRICTSGSTSFYSARHPPSTCRPSRRPAETLSIWAGRAPASVAGCGQNVLNEHVRVLSFDMRSHSVALKCARAEFAYWQADPAAVPVAGHRAMLWRLVRAGAAGEADMLDALRGQCRRGGILAAAAAGLRDAGLELREARFGAAGAPNTHPFAITSMRRCSAAGSLKNRCWSSTPALRRLAHPSAGRRLCRPPHGPRTAPWAVVW